MHTHIYSHPRHIYRCRHRCRLHVNRNVVASTGAAVIVVLQHVAEIEVDQVNKWRDDENDEFEGQVAVVAIGSGEAMISRANEQIKRDCPVVDFRHAFAFYVPLFGQRTIRRGRPDASRLLR